MREEKEEWEDDEWEPGPDTATGVHIDNVIVASVLSQTDEEVVVAFSLKSRGSDWYGSYTVKIPKAELKRI